MDQRDRFNEIDKILRQRPRLVGKNEHLTKGLEELRELEPHLILLGSGRLLGHRWESIRGDAEQTFELGLSKIDEKQFEGIIGSWWAGWPATSVWIYSVNARSLSTLEVEGNRNYYRVLSLSHNGYNRELALRELAKAPEALDWPFVLARLHDWVPQVRAAAQALAQALLNSEHAGQIARWPSLLSGLATRHRSATSDIVTWIIDFAGRSGVLVPIWSRLGRDFRRQVIRTLSNRSLMTEDLLQVVLKSDDTGAIREVLDRHVATFERTTEMLDHPNPVARGHALAGYAKWKPGEVEVVKRALADSSSRVRKIAQALLRKQGLEPRMLYLALLESGIVSRATIEGFCEVAMVDDRDRLLKILVNGSVRRRYAAARVLAAQSVEEILPRLIQDESARVRKVGIEYVRKNPLAMDIDSREALLRSSDPGVQHAGMTLLMNQARWPSLRWILQFLAHEDEEVRNSAFEELRRWLWWASHTPSIPSREVYQATWLTFETCRDAVPSGVQGQLASILDWVGRQIEPN